MIPTAAMENMKSLHTLTLSGNPISKIHNKYLWSLKNLVTLHLNCMKSLFEIGLGTLDELQILEIFTLQERTSCLEIPTKALINKCQNILLTESKLIRQRIHVYSNLHRTSKTVCPVVPG